MAPRSVLRRLWWSEEARVLDDGEAEVESVLVADDVTALELLAGSDTAEVASEVYVEAIDDVLVVADPADEADTSIEDLDVSSEELAVGETDPP